MDTIDSIWSYFAQIKRNELVEKRQIPNDTLTFARFLIMVLVRKYAVWDL